MSSFPWGFREGHPTRSDLLVTALAAALVVEPPSVAATGFATGMLAASVAFGVLEAVVSWVGADR